MPLPVLAAAPAVGKFVLANWRFVLPVLLVGWAMYERNGWQDCERDWAAARLEAANKLLEQKVADAKLREDIQVKLDDAQEQLRRRATSVIERIREVPVNTACPAPRALGVANDGLQSLGFVPEAGPAK